MERHIACSGLFARSYVRPEVEGEASCVHLGLGSRMGVWRSWCVECAGCAACWQESWTASEGSKTGLKRERCFLDRKF